MSRNCPLSDCVDHVRSGLYKVVLSDPDHHLVLHPIHPRLFFPRLARIDYLEIEVTEQLCHQASTLANHPMALPVHVEKDRTYLEYHLVDLHECNGFTRALKSSNPECHLNVALHFNFLLVTAFKVALGAEHVRVVPEYVFSQEHCDPVHVHGSLSRKEQTINRVAFRWNHFGMP